jgi:diguanylate cyclase (GGDEF)-like protein
MADVNKHLERARRSLEKNKLRDAVAEYQLALEEAPANQEALQALADLYTRLNEPVRAAQYYGMQFDRLVEAGDVAKASAIFSRFLRAIPQPPDRLMRYAVLLQRQNRVFEAIEQYAVAAERFKEQGHSADALTCYERIAQLDPENAARHVTMAELAEGLGHAELASRGYLRAGQLTQAAGGLDQALELFERGYNLAPQDRTAALLFAEARLRKGNAAGAVKLLEPFAPNESDPAFLLIFGDALLKTSQLDRARHALEAHYRQKQEGFGKLFELSLAYLRSKEEEKAIAVLTQTREWMKGVRRDNEFAAQVERLGGMVPTSVMLAEFTARLYEEMNRESKYFDALVHLFDLYLDVNRVPQACDTIDRLLDIDPYDYRNQERIAKLEGKADPAYLRSVHSRTARAATMSSRTEGFAGAGSALGDRSSETASEEGRAQQALEDLVVQVEIFLQYSLQSKAVERLERIGELFPGEEEKNERLRTLYERANWWPKGGPPKPKPIPVAPLPAAAPTPPASPLGFSAETHRDLAAISEITRLMYRQADPREVLKSSVQEICRYLNAARCIVAVGPPGEAAQITAEFSAAGLPALGTPGLVAALGLLKNATPDALGGIELHGANTPALRAHGLESALGILLTDKETQAAAGALMVGSAVARKWQPNVSFFLQAVGDQIVISTNHTRLRSLVRTLAMADEKTGLLSRGAYLDCLMAEANRSRLQNAPLSLLILQVDRGGELLRQHGDAPLEQYMEQLARTLASKVRQTDVAVKYTAWSIAFVLPDTSLENAQLLAEKLRQAASNIPSTWNGPGLTLSAVVAEASRRPADEPEDRVTEWINRVEAGLDEVRQQGGNTILPLKTP